MFFSLWYSPLKCCLNAIAVFVRLRWWRDFTKIFMDIIIFSLWFPVHVWEYKKVYVILRNHARFLFLLKKVVPFIIIFISISILFFCSPNFLVCLFVPPSVYVSACWFLVKLYPAMDVKMKKKGRNYPEQQRNFWLRIMQWIVGASFVFWSGFV